MGGDDTLTIQKDGALHQTHGDIFKKLLDTCMIYLKVFMSAVVYFLKKFTVTAGVTVTVRYSMQYDV